MGSLKTYVLAGVLAMSAVQAGAAPLTTTFATCAGRLSAELEHAWLMGAAGADEIAQRRQQFIDLVAATVTPEARRDVLNLRINAKFAHSGLLTHAAFSDDADRAALAARRARAEIGYCLSLLLES